MPQTYKLSFPHKHNMSTTTGMSVEQAALIAEEDRVRRLLVTNSEEEEARNSHVMLLDAFALNEDLWARATEDPDEARVPKILEQARAPADGSRAVVRNLAEFQGQWAEFTKNMFSGLDWNNVFVAGGAVLACMLPRNGGDGYAQSDIDLYVYGLNTPEAANDKLRHVCQVVAKNVGPHSRIIRTRRTVTILNSHPHRHVQIILRLQKSPAEVLLSFDIDSCAFGYDGSSVWCLERARRALTKSYNLVNPWRRSMTYETRLFKYSKRGFAVAVPGLDKSRINHTRLFAPGVLPSHYRGLARLLIYDHLASAPAAAPVPLGRRRGRKPLPPARPVPAAEDADYNAIAIPWGPGWSASDVLDKLVALDKAQLFSRQARDPLGDNEHKHLFISGSNLDAVIAGDTKDFWCKTCQLAEDPSGIYVEQGTLEWSTDHTAYQDLDCGGEYRRAIPDAEVLAQPWEALAYIGQDSISAKPAAPVSTPTASPVRSTRTPAQRTTPISPSHSPLPPALHLSPASFTAPRLVEDRSGDDGFACRGCGQLFTSANALLKHARAANHLDDDERSASTSSSNTEFQLLSGGSALLHPSIVSVALSSPSNTPSLLSQPAGQTQPAARDEISSSLVAINLCYRQGRLDAGEREALKVLLVRGLALDVFSAALEVYRIENDVDDLAHTLQRLAAAGRSVPSASAIAATPDQGPRPADDDPYGIPSSSGSNLSFFV